MTELRIGRGLSTNQKTIMKSTINGDGHSISATSDRELTVRLLRYLQFHRPEDRGQHVLIWVDKEELFEDFADLNPVHDDPIHILMAMHTLCSTVNKMWAEQTKDHISFDEVNELTVPDPKDIKLEVVMEGQWDGTQFVAKGPVFQILTKKWVGLLPLSDRDGYQCNSFSYIPV